jgi:hypothetical protein
MRSGILLLALSFAAPSLALASELERSIALAPGERLRIELARGDVEVFTHQGGEVRLEARARGLGASAVEFLVTREGNEVVLRSRCERWLDWLARGPQVTVRAFVPRHLGLAVSTSGHVAARDGAVLLVPTVRGSEPAVGRSQPSGAARALPALYDARHRPASAPH